MMFKRKTYEYNDFYNDIVVMDINEIIGDQVSTCQSCFSEYEKDQMVRCNQSDEHYFCKDCIRIYVSSCFANGESGLSCVFNNKCLGKFGFTDFEKCLTQQMINNVKDIDEIEQIEELSHVNPDFYICPKCRKYGCIAENYKFITCEICKNEWCICCELQAHPNKKCYEMNENDDQELIVKNIEEIITMAKLHICPNCKIKFIREDGCNLITCSHCHTFSCYICGIEIIPSGVQKNAKYWHFIGCGNKDATCPLFTLSTYIDKKNMLNKCKQLLFVNKSEKIQDLIVETSKKYGIEIKLEDEESIRNHTVCGRICPIQ